MENVQSSPNTSLAIRLIKLPFQGVWFLVKHPIVAVLFVLLTAFSVFTFLAHFNPIVAERLNSAVGYFGGAILVHESADIIRKHQRRVAALETDLKTKNSAIARKNAALQKSAKALKASAKVHQQSARSLGIRAKAIREKNSALKRASNSLRNASESIRIKNVEITKKTNLLNANETRLKNFQARGVKLENVAKRKFVKVALYDAAGEFLGWIPIAGDAASIVMAAAGIYEMCQMMKEIEQATEELGVRFNIYTDTFCEKPAETTKEIIADTAGKVKDSMNASFIVFKDKTATVSTSTIERVQNIIAQAFEKLLSLYEGN